MQFISVFLDITKINDKRNADVSRNQGVCQVIYIFFRSALRKLKVCQVSSF